VEELTLLDHVVYSQFSWTIYTIGSFFLLQFSGIVHLERHSKALRENVCKTSLAKALIMESHFALYTEEPVLGKSSLFQ
jgi:hypothetical protein